jgi:hypothetical protein
MLDIDEQGQGIGIVVREFQHKTKQINENQDFTYAKVTGAKSLYDIGREKNK